MLNTFQRITVTGLNGSLRTALRVLTAMREGCKVKFLTEPTYKLPVSIILTEWYNFKSVQFFFNYPISCMEAISFYLCVSLIDVTCCKLLNGSAVKCRLSCPKPLVPFSLIKTIPSLLKACLASATAQNSCIFILFSSMKTCPRQREEHLWRPGADPQSEGVSDKRWRLSSA